MHSDALSRHLRHKNISTFGVQVPSKPVEVALESKGNMSQPGCTDYMGLIDDFPKPLSMYGAECGVSL